MSDDKKDNFQKLSEKIYKTSKTEDNSTEVEGLREAFVSGAIKARLQTLKKIRNHLANSTMVTVAGKSGALQYLNKEIETAEKEEKERVYDLILGKAS